LSLSLANACRAQALNTSTLNTAPIPLVIDLENALLQSDLAIESLFALLKENPLSALRLFVRLAGARDSTVVLLEESRAIDASNIPYNAETITRIHAERQRGTPVYLVSKQYCRYAQAIAAHLQVFDRVITPDDVASGKLDQRGSEETEFFRPTSNGRTIFAWLGAMRLHQWLKNLLIFVPLLASHWVRERTPVLHAAFAFLLFGLCASSSYLLNDLFDLNDDRHHPTKRYRALAKGSINIHAVLLVVPLLLVISLLGAWLFLPRQFCVVLAAYYVITLAYSLALKRIMMLDVVVLAMLYTVRVIAGTVAIDGNLTFWMLAFCLFIFMSLALAKRYAELIDSKSRGLSEKVRGRGYFKADLQMISALGAASGYIAVLVLALYVQDQNTITLYRHPQMIWFACPLLLFWIGRTWMLTHRGEMHDDPLVFAIRDRTSLIVAVVFGLIFVLAV
jgi:4-hydroxybenzoate polyprenyltransferase